MDGREQPRILLIDIETRPMVAEIWGLRDQNVGLNQIREFGGVLCFGALWFGQKKMQFYSDWRHGHEEMIDHAHRLFQEADAICGYNSDRFDIRKLQAEFAPRGLIVKPTASIDVYKVVKQKFFWDSHKLDHVANMLGVGRKITHEGHGLWSKVLQGDEKAQRLMERYCKQDVRLLERVYERLRPWMTNHPKLTEDRGACHKCGSTNLTSQGWKPTVNYRVQSLRCSDCGGWQQGKRERIAA